MSTPPQGAGWQPGEPHGSGPPWQQGPFLHPPGPPPPTGNGLKWLLCAVAVLLVIAVAVGVTVIVMTRHRESEASPSATAATAATGEIASADDTGPADTITDEPTCASYIVVNPMSEIEANGWSGQRAVLGPLSQWSAEQKSQTQAVGTAMRSAAEQVIPLSRKTLHRLMRELDGH